MSDICLLPGQLSSGEIILLRADLVRTECSGIFQNSSFSPPTAGSMRGFFSNTHYKDLEKFLEVKLTKVSHLGLLGLCFSSQTLHTEPLAIF